MIFIFIGYVCAVLMGLTLGLIGAGGSILAVPIMVYLLNVPPIIATGYSFLVVGTTAAIGALSYWRKGKVHVQKALTFILPALAAVIYARTHIVPSLPHHIFSLTKNDFIMCLFAFLMLITSILMWRPISVHKVVKQSFASSMLKILFGSLLVGLITGVIGAGGGFLIIPSLMLIFNLEMNDAVGTSLLIITMNALTGFMGDVSMGFKIDWHLISVFLIMTISGVLLGNKIGTKIAPLYLKKMFSIFLVILSGIILFKEI